MPKLGSGRRIAFSTSPYLEALGAESDEIKYFAIVDLRLHAGTPEALRDHPVISYFIDGEGTPPDAPTRNSGFCVADVLEGRTDRSDDEVEELCQFIDHDPRFGPSLRSQFDEINESICTNPVCDASETGIVGKVRGQVADRAFLAHVGMLAQHHIECCRVAADRVSAAARYQMRSTS